MICRAAPLGRRRDGALPRLESAHRARGLGVQQMPDVLNRVLSAYLHLLLLNNQDTVMIGIPLTLLDIFGIHSILVVYLSIYLSIYIYTYIYIYLDLDLDLSIYTYIYFYVYLYLYIYLYIFMAVRGAGAGCA